MNRTIFRLKNLVVVFSLVNLPTACNHSSQGKKGNTIQLDTATGMVSVKSADSAMNVAIAKAKQTINEFDIALQSGNPQYSEFSVKKRFLSPDGSKGEHMWIAQVTLEKGAYRGIVNNEAHITREVNYGDTVIVRKDEITDWMYLEANVLRGGFTIRTIRDRLTKEEKEQLDRESGFIIDDN